MSSGVPSHEMSAERSVRLILQFLDLSRDVDRNREDAAHRERNGTISYMMDAGVVEVFLNCRDPRGRPASLHTQEWLVGNQDTRNWSSYAAQTVLTMMDYILGGSLPGQQGGMIYMSLWHRKEMMRRLERLAPERSKELRAITPAMAAARFDRVSKVLEAFRRGDRLSTLDGIDAELRSDLQDFSAPRASSKVPGPDEVEAYLETRLALGVLAADRVIEPAQQLERVLTLPLRRMFTTLEAAMSIPKGELDAIRRAAVQWFERLKDECGRRNVEIVDAQSEGAEHDGDERRRSMAALWDDARTIALLLWASVPRKQRDRLVFVTADSIVFDAYRRWYANLELTDPAYLQPFCMRRLRQYAPSFNLIDSGLVRGDRYRALFNEIMQVLELMLLPLNLSRIQSKAGENIVNRMRDLSALRLLDSRRITEETAYRGLTEAIRAVGADKDGGPFPQLINRWRELERAALAQADTEVERRTQKFDSLFTHVAHETEERAKAFEQYVERLVGNIEQGSRALGLPLAREVIERWQSPEGQHAARAPIALRLAVPLNSGSVDVGLALMRRLEGRGERSPEFIRSDQWEELYGQPHAMFAIAAALTITAGDWADGTYFSDLSLRAIQGNVAAGRVAATDEVVAEIMYLSSLAKRFRIGDLGPPLTQDVANSILGLRRQALDLNDQCVAFYGRGPHPKKLRTLRSYSERAALWLFLASAMHPEVTRLAQRAAGRSGALPTFGDAATAINAIDRAEDDLRRCLEIDAVEATDDQRELFKNRLRRQIYTNAASAYVLRRLWGGDTPKESLFSPENPVAIARARNVVAQGRGPSVMTADVLTFLAFANDGEARAALRRMRQLERSQAVLTLDIYVVEALKQMIAHIGA